MNRLDQKIFDEFPNHLKETLGKQSAGYLSIAAMTIAGVYLAFALEDYFSFILALAAMHIMVGVGLNILLGLSGQVSFGHIGFFAIGAYTTAILTLQGVGFWLSLLCAGLVSGGVGFLLALPALRVSGPYLAMMTIAFAFIVEHGAIEWKALTGGANGLTGFPSPELFGRVMNAADIAALGCLLAGASLLFYCRLSHGAWGKGMAAVRDSETAAQSLGLNVVIIKTVSFTLSALITGIAGALFTPLNMFISPGSFTFIQSILFILAVVIGGAGALWGPVFGAVLIVLIPEILSGFEEYRLLFFGGLLLAVLWLAPRGIVGSLSRLFQFEAPALASRDAAGMRYFLRRQTNHGQYLSVEKINISFGGVHAVKDISFRAEAGKITSLIGPNGAGKTTVLNMISGFYTPDSGKIKLSGEDIAGMKTHTIARKGIARTYQTTLLFERLSVLDNILIALDQGKLGLITSGATKPEKTRIARNILAFTGYARPLARMAGELPHVDKRLVEIARSLATNPAVLLLDEPAAGLMKDDKKKLATLLREIAGLGIIVVLVEHDMSLVMEITDHLVVLDAGMLLKSGLPEEARNDRAVMRAYLGEAEFEARPRAAPWNGSKDAIITALQLAAGYGAAPVLEDIDLKVRPGEMVAVLGANGAGKSTMLRAISGLHRPIKGSVILNDVEIAREPAYKITAAGLSLAPEGRQLFPQLTVLDNILLGAFSRKNKIDWREIEDLLQRFPRLRDRLASKAGILSGGEQQMVAIARGLIAKPDILLLDEPSLGLAPSMIAELFDTLADLRDEGITILIVDQMANLVLAVADRGYVLENGRIVYSDQAKELKNDPAIVRAYLGH